MTTQIIIDFDSDKYEKHFLNDVKKALGNSDFKPKTMTITIKEEIK